MQLGPLGGGGQLQREALAWEAAWVGPFWQWLCWNKEGTLERRPMDKTWLLALHISGPQQQQRAPGNGSSYP